MAKTEEEYVLKHASLTVVEARYWRARLVKAGYSIGQAERLVETCARLHEAEDLVLVHHCDVDVAFDILI